MIFRIHRIRPLFLCTLLCLTVMGCSSASKEKEVPPDAPLRDNTPQVLTPEASGSIVHENETVTLDISNVSQGYLILTYSGTNKKVKFR